MQDRPNETLRSFVSTDIAGRRDFRVAVATILASGAFILAALPFAKLPLAHLTGFVAAQQSILVICDLMTAALLFTQFSFLRARALLVLAAGYLFTALMACAHTLSYQELFAPNGLLGAGPQTTAWLYFFWHGGFPLFVVAYALLKGRGGLVRSEPWTIIAAAIGAVFLIACALMLLASGHADALPAIMAGSVHAHSLPILIGGFWGLSFVALAVLGWRRPHTVLDIWLLVVISAWIFDIGLGAVFNTGRVDFGFYAGRIYGLLAATVLLIALMVENSMHYSRLVRVSAELATANIALELLSLKDELTNLANRRFFESYLTGQIAIARRERLTLGFMLCDIDAFKAFTDHFGNQAGDACLKRVAAALQSCCQRPADIAARYGSEKFALILPNTELDGVLRIAEDVRAAVEGLKIAHPRSPAVPFVTISGGVAVHAGGTGMTLEELIAIADRNLYRAKRSGRNRIVGAPVGLVAPAAEPMVADRHSRPSKARSVAFE